MFFDFSITNLTIFHFPLLLFWLLFSFCRAVFSHFVTVQLLWAYEMEWQGIYVVLGPRILCHPENPHPHCLLTRPTIPKQRAIIISISVGKTGISLLFSVWWNFLFVRHVEGYSTILRKEYMENILLWCKSKVLIDIIFILFAVEWMTGGEVSYGTNVFGSRLRGWS